MKRIGLLFGTFNPIHVGHLIIANHMANYTDLDQVWLIVTPHNPLKERASLLDDIHRLAMVRRAVEDNNKLHASGVEFDLPKPSYTVFTLAHLRNNFTDHEFTLIMGEDNLRNFHLWKEYERILEGFKIKVYPRQLTPQELAKEEEFEVHPTVKDHPNIEVVNAPVLDISATFIRNAVKEGKDVRYLLTEPVHQCMTEMHFYKK